MLCFHANTFYRYFHRIKTAKALHERYDPFFQEGFEVNRVPVKRTETKQTVDVPYSSIIQANRLLWSSPVHSKYMTKAREPPAPISLGARLFNQTPLARFPVKFSRLCTFHKNGHEFKIGDFCRVRIDGEIDVCRIEKLEYIRWKHKSNHPYPYLKIYFTQLTKASRSFSKTTLRNEYWLELGSWADSTAKDVIDPFSMRIVESGDDYTDWPAKHKDAEGRQTHEGIVRLQRRGSGSRHYKYELYKHPWYKFDYEDDNMETTYISLFIDGFTTGSQSQTTKGVYINWLNADGQVRNREAFIHIAMLIPSGVAEYEALAPVRRDISCLEQGIEMFSWKHQSTVVLQMYVATLALDLVGAYSLLRHGGNRSTLVCPGCLINIKKKLDFKAPLERRRRLTFTDLCVTQIKSVQFKMLAQKTKSGQPARLSQTKDQEIRKSYSVLPTRNPFEGLTLDPHSQYFRCTSHMFLFGMFKKMYRHLVEKCMTPMMRFAIQASFFTVDDPHRTAPRLSAQARDGQTSALSMEEFRRLSLLASSCFDGLLHPELLAHFRQLWFIYSASTGDSLLTDADLHAIQKV